MSTLSASYFFYVFRINKVADISVSVIVKKNISNEKDRIILYYRECEDG